MDPFQSTSQNIIKFWVLLNGMLILKLKNLNCKIFILCMHFFVCYLWLYRRISQFASNKLVLKWDMRYYCQFIRWSDKIFAEKFFKMRPGIDKRYLPSCYRYCYISGTSGYSRYFVSYCGCLNCFGNLRISCKKIKQAYFGFILRLGWCSNANHQKNSMGDFS